jgi:surface antigen
LKPTWAAQLQGVTEPAQLGDAYTWATAAAAVGFQVSELPVPGALVVWQPNVEGAGEETGHVGYVESVSPDGSTFSTSEENFGGVFLMGYRTLSTTPVAGRSFILP